MQSMHVNRCRAAFAMPVALAVIAVLVILVLSLTFLGRQSASVKQTAETKPKYEQVAHVVSGKVIDLLSSGAQPDRPALAALGMSAPPPAPGQGTATFGGTMEGYTFSGSFNGGSDPWSTYSPVATATLDTEQDGYGAKALPSYDPRLPVPPHHSLVFVKVQGEKQPPATYYSLISTMAPYAALCPEGDVELRSATFTTNPDVEEAAKAETASGGRFYVAAGGRVAVKDTFTGVAQSKLPAAQKPFEKIADRTKGEQQPDTPIDAQTAKMLANIAKFLEEVEHDTERAKDPSFKQLVEWLAKAMATKIGGLLLADVGNFSWDGTQLVWAGDFYCPPQSITFIPFKLKITGSLYVDKRAVLVIRDNLTVENYLLMKRNTLVYVQKGDIEVKNRVEMLYSADNYHGITSGLIARDEVHLRKGVRHMHGHVAFKKTGVNPFKQTEGNSSETWQKAFGALFLSQQKLLFEQLTGFLGILSQFLAGELSLGTETKKTPGLLICSEKKGVYIYDTEKDATLAGLILAKDTVWIEMPPDGSGTFTGFMFAGKKLYAYNAKVRYYPYYTHVLIPIPTDDDGKSDRLLNVSMPHVVSSGEYRK